MVFIWTMWKKSNSIEFYQVMQATNQPPSHLYHLQYQLKLYEEYVHVWKSVFFIIESPNQIVSLLHSEENHKKKLPQKMNQQKNSPHNLNDLFISILIEQMHSQIEKQTINSPSNTVCVDVRKKELGCMIKLSETKENSFKSIFWHKR